MLPGTGAYLLFMQMEYRRPARQAQETEVVLSSLKPGGNSKQTVPRRRKKSVVLQVREGNDNLSV